MPATLDNRPIAYILRSRFQPCLRAHYNAVRSLVLANIDKFAQAADEAAQKAVVVLMVVRDLAHDTKNEENPRFWPEFNPLTGAEVIRQLELAMWEYLETDQLDNEQRRQLRRVFAHSVFPVQMPTNTKGIAQAIENQFGLNHKDEEYNVSDLTIGMRPVIDDNLSMFHVVKGRYRPCWYFPILDNEDAWDAKRMARKIRDILCGLNGEQRKNPILSKGNTPLILLGDCDEAQIDKRVAIRAKNHELGAYGIHLLRDLIPDEDSEPVGEQPANSWVDGLLSELGVDQLRLIQVSNWLTCANVRTYMKNQRFYPQNRSNNLKREADWFERLESAFADHSDHFEILRECGKIETEIADIFDKKSLPKSLIGVQKIDCHVSQSIHGYLAAIEHAAETLKPVRATSFGQSGTSSDARRQLQSLINRIKDWDEAGDSDHRHLPMLYDEINFGFDDITGTTLALTKIADAASKASQPAYPLTLEEIIKSFTDAEVTDLVAKLKKSWESYAQ